MMGFIKREKLYIFMLFFILAVNILDAGRVEKTQVREEKPLSVMTFNETGITEQKVKDYIVSDRPGARFFRYGVIAGAFIFILAIALNIAFIFLGKKLVVTGGADIIPISWGIRDIVRASLIVIFLGYIVAIIEGFIFKMFNIDIGLNLRMILNTFILDIAVVMVVVYFVTVKHGEKIQALGLKLSSCFRNILSGIVAYIFILPLLLIALLLSIMVLNFFGYTPPPQPVFDVFMEERRVNVLLLLTVFVSILGPVAEEVFFRGFMYSAIKKRFGIVAAVFLSASIFSLLHTNIVGFLPIMILGALLAYLYEKTGSLMSSITIHIMHNSIIVSFVFFIKELMA
ncbi:MAG: CPBP family intramembrane metalloprotease [Candidatus Omnitrophica bacterium]|nr:CPBP family intramembrane metalloprotease [Candidatus Omnitrophota bacterium]